MRLLIGDCRDSMRTLIAEGVRVQTCVTSPPYWGLRDYGVEGQLGLEQTIEQFVANMVEVFRLVRELLADDGTCWINLGDSYAAAPNGNKNTFSSTLTTRADGTRKRDLAETGRLGASGNKGNGAADLRAPHRGRQNGLKPKDLCGIPWRVAFALQADGWWLRQDIIWHKPNPMPESIKDRCTKAHEYVFLMAKSERYFYDADAIKEKSSENTNPRVPGNVRPAKGQQAYIDGAEEHRTKAGLLAYAERARARMPAGWATCDTPHNAIAHQRAENHRKVASGGDATKNNASFNEAMAVMPEVRNKRDVWTVASDPYPEAHFATYPPALIEPCILAGSRPGDTVFDPFFGSGTTGEVAQRLGRNWIGCELNPEYGKLAERRTSGTLGLVFTHEAA